MSHHHPQHHHSQQQQHIQWQSTLLPYSPSLSMLPLRVSLDPSWTLNHRKEVTAFDTLRFPLDSPLVFLDSFRHLERFFTRDSSHETMPLSELPVTQTLQRVDLENLAKEQKHAGVFQDAVSMESPRATTQEPFVLRPDFIQLGSAIDEKIYLVQNPRHLSVFFRVWTALELYEMEGREGRTWRTPLLEAVTWFTMMHPPSTTSPDSQFGPPEHNPCFLFLALAGRIPSSLQVHYPPDSPWIRRAGPDLHLKSRFVEQSFLLQEEDEAVSYRERLTEEDWDRGKRFCTGILREPLFRKLHEKARDLKGRITRIQEKARGEGGMQEFMAGL